MAKKQFKIGEYAIGGIIAVEITGKVIQVKALDYNTKKEVSGYSGSVVATERQAQWKLDNLLNEITSSYYASKVMDWVKTKVTFDYIF